MNKNVEYYLLTLKAYINNSGAGIEAEILDIFLTDDIATSAGFLKNRDSSILLFYVQFWNCSYILKLTDQCSCSSRIEQKTEELKNLCFLFNSGTAATLIGKPYR